MKLAELFVDITGRDAGLNRTLANVHRTLAGFASSSAGLLRGAVGAGGALGAAGAAGLSYGLFEAFQKASELNATISKTKIIFGDAAASVIDSGKAMADQFGVTQKEYINAAAGFGAVFKGMGKGQKEAAEIGNRLAKLGLDMASFEGAGVSAAEAFTALQAALRGEFDPLERFRVFLSADKIETYALANGLAKTKKGLDDAAKKAAIMGLIFRQTADAQGDMARTAGESDNQYKKITGSFANLVTTIGQELMPAFDGFLALSNTVMADLTAGVEQHKGAFSSFVESVKSGLGEVGVFYRNWGDVVELTSLNAGESLTKVEVYVSHLANSFRALYDYIIENAIGLGKTLYHALKNPLDSIVAAVTGVKSIIDKVLAGEEIGQQDLLGLLAEDAQEAFKALPEFVLPPIDTSALEQFEAERNRIMDRIAGREAGELAKAKQAAAATRGEAPGPEGKAPEKTKDRKAGYDDLAGFAKQIQIGAFGKDGATVKAIGELKDVVGGGLDKVDKTLKGGVGGPGYAVGQA